MTFPVTMNHDPDMTGVGSGNTAQTISVDYAQCYRVGGYAVWDEGATADCEI